MVEETLYEEAARLFEAGEYGKALAAYISSAKLGSVQSKVMVGWMLEQGFGTSPDLPEAERWYRDAALMNYAFAQFKLAKLCARCDRRAEAIAWYEKAAGNNFSPAIFRLGWMLDVGKGVTIDKQRAMQLYLKAATLGHVFAERQLGLMLVRGYGGALRVPSGIRRVLNSFLRGVFIGMRNMDDERIMT